MPRLLRADTGTVTLSGVAAGAKVDTLFDNFHGIIRKIEVVCSASSDLWIYSDASDKDNGDIVDNNILGLTGAKITVNTTLVAYPVVAQVVGTTNATTDPDQYDNPIIGGRIECSFANVADGDTYRVVLYYEPIQGEA